MAICRIIARCLQCWRHCQCAEAPDLVATESPPVTRFRSFSHCEPIGIKSFASTSDALSALPSPWPISAQTAPPGSGMQQLEMSGPALHKHL